MNEDHELTREEKRELYHKKLEEDKSTKKRKTVMKLVAFLLMICLLLVFWQYRQKLLPENAYESFQLFLADMKSGDGFPYVIKGTESQNADFKCSNHHVAVLSGTGLTVLNTKGSKLIESQHSYLCPAVACSDTRYLIYGIGEKKYKIESVTGLIREAETESKILDAAVSESGKYLLATESQTHASEFSVYSSNGELEYNYKLSSSYITDTAMNSAGTGGVVCGMSSSGGVLSSEIYVFDFSSEKPLCVYKTENTLYFDVCFGKKSIICVGEDRITFLSKDGELKEELPLDSGRLLCYDIYEDSVAVALDLYGASGDTEILTVNSKGEKSAEIKTDKSINAISFYGNVTAALTNDDIRIYSTEDGSLIKRLEAESYAHDIALNDVSSIYIMGFSQVYFEAF